jgi:hypothetical protein
MALPPIREMERSGHWLFRIGTTFRWCSFR